MTRMTYLSSATRLTFGEPDWEHLSEQEVIDLIGAEEVAALPPR
jgi:hypothetical protein